MRAAVTVPGSVTAGLEPGVCRHRVADALVQARQARGLTQQQAARALDWSLSKLTRIEAGTSGLQVTDLRAALDLYQAHDPARTGRLTELARAGRRRPWYSQYHQVTAPWLGVYLDTERSATAITGYRTRTVPGLLQTPGYAQALLLATGRDQVAGRVALLAARQELLRSATCPRICYLIEEGALRRPAGGAAVMAAQLDRLRQAAKHPQVTVRVVPFTAPVPPAGDLTVFTLPDRTSSSWHETADGRLAPCNPAAAQGHRDHLTRLLELSVPVEAL
jgi:transcriptional regulator with XRE-family HTH domain